MKTLIFCLGFIFLTSIVPAHAAIMPAASRHNAIIWTDSSTFTNDTKLSEKRPLIIVTDETGRTYFIFQHQLAGMSWVASHHIPYVSPF